MVLYEGKKGQEVKVNTGQSPRRGRRDLKQHKLYSTEETLEYHGPNM